MADQTKFTDQTVKIAELINDPDLPTLFGYEFTNCLILGPAVLIQRGRCDFVRSAFDGAASVDEFFWFTRPGLEAPRGAIGINECRFTECNFTNVGFAGVQEVYDMMKANINFGS